MCIRDSGNLIRQTYKKTPIILGGIEASLRRLAHYDYWSNQLKRSILLDSGADLVSYGMGERSIIEIAEALDAGLDIKDITYIDGTVCKVKNLDSVYDAEILEPYEEMKKDKLLYAKSFYRPVSYTHLVEEQADPRQFLPFSEALDESILSACDSITKIGGYMIVFSVLISFMAKLSFQNFFWKLLLLPGVELTGGIRMLCQLDLTSELRFLLVMAQMCIRDRYCGCFGDSGTGK